MTKTDVLAARVCRNDVSDLHFALGYDDAVDQ
jgi:hypothetical protein